MVFSLISQQTIPLIETVSSEEFADSHQFLCKVAIFVRYYTLPNLSVTIANLMVSIYPIVVSLFILFVLKIYTIPYCLKCPSNR
jgi:hypothetical protein